MPNKLSLIYIYTKVHVATFTYIKTHPYIYTNIYIHIPKHTNKQPYIHTQINMHRNSHTLTYLYRCRYKNTHIEIYSHKITQQKYPKIHTNTHTHTSHTETYTHI